MENTRYEYSPIVDRPQLQWPNGAQVAVWVIPNVEHFEIDVSSVSISPTNHKPDILNYAWRDYGLRVGIWRMMEILDRHGVRATVALNSAVCERYPAIIEAGKKRGWEFMAHGITNSRPLANLPEEEEREVIRTAIASIKENVGMAPKGWLGPALAETFNSPDILAEEGIEYVCDWCNDDQPYPMKVKKGRLISMPYSIEVNDIPIFVGKGMTGMEFFELVRDQFEVLYNDGKTTGRVMAIALHPFLIGVPFRSKYLDMALGYIKQHEHVWLATGSEIADWYIQNVPRS